MLSIGKNILRSIPTPWMVAKSVSAIRVEIDENAHGYAEFDVCVLPPKDSREYPYGQLSYVRRLIKFTDAQWVRTAPALDMSLQQLGFDTRHLRIRSQENLDEDLKRFREEWVANGVCPESGFYEVQKSTWIDNVDRRNRFGLKHYFIDGCDMNAELLADGWEEIELADDAASPAIDVDTIDPNRRF